MQFVEWQRLGWNSSLKFKIKSLDLDHKGWEECLPSFCISSWIGFLKFFVGPGEPKWLRTQQVDAPPKSEQRKRKGAEVEKAGEGESVPLTLKEQHVNYIQSSMQMICKSLCEWASVLFASTAQALLGEPSSAFSQSCSGSGSLAGSVD